jgi:hypothetical protein
VNRVLASVELEVNSAIGWWFRQTGSVVAESVGAFLGEDLIIWLLLALGGALFVGNVMALVRPPSVKRDDADLDQAPRGRSMAMAGLGLAVALAALGALLRG